MDKVGLYDIKGLFLYQSVHFPNDTQADRPATFNDMSGNIVLLQKLDKHFILWRIVWMLYDQKMHIDAASLQCRKQVEIVFFRT